VFLACIAFFALIGCNQARHHCGREFRNRSPDFAWRPVGGDGTQPEQPRGETVRMDLQASFVNQWMSTFGGVIELRNDQPLRLNGSVDGGFYERYVQPRVELLAVQVRANITDPNGHLVRALNCSR
jgi:hypothetical protein